MPAVDDFLKICRGEYEHVGDISDPGTLLDVAAKLWEADGDHHHDGPVECCGWCACRNDANEIAKGAMGGEAQSNER